MNTEQDRHIDNSEQNLCGANSANNQLIYNGTNGNLNNNNRFNSNRVRVSLEFEDKEASPSSSSQWFRYYRIARQNKRKKATHLHFRLHCFDNLSRIKQDVEAMEYVPRRSVGFVVTKPKVREIIAADFSDRIVQTYLVQRIQPKMETYLHPDSFSCRVGRGSLRAAQHLFDVIHEATAGYTRDAWVYKFDFRSFFMSIDTELWTRRITDWIDEHMKTSDAEQLKYVARVIFQSLPQMNYIEACHPAMFQLVPEHKKQRNKASFVGIPIGNVTSQAMANFSTTPFLRFVASIVDGFSHYTDDNCGVVTDKERFLALRPVIAAFARDDSHFTLHPDKFYLQHASKGVEFLGYRIRYNVILPSVRLIHNFKWKMTIAIRRATESRTYMFQTKDKFVSTINSYCGLLKHTASFKLRRRELKRLQGSPWSEVLDFDETEWLKVSIKAGYKKDDYYRQIAQKRKRQFFSNTLKPAA